MKDAGNMDLIEQCLNACLPDHQHRQAVIKKVTVKLLLAGYRVEEALYLFYWKLSELEPPVTHEEILFFRALYRLFHLSCEPGIDSKVKALETLKISQEKLEMPPKELLKEAKIAYWKHFNGCSLHPVDLLAHASEIVVKKKAFNFLIKETSP